MYAIDGTYGNYESEVYSLTMRCCERLRGLGYWLVFDCVGEYFDNIILGELALGCWIYSDS